MGKIGVEWWKRQTLVVGLYNFCTWVPWYIYWWISRFLVMWRTAVTRIVYICVCVTFLIAVQGSISKYLRTQILIENTHYNNILIRYHRSLFIFLIIFYESPKLELWSNSSNSRKLAKYFKLRIYKNAFMYI